MPVKTVNSVVRDVIGVRGGGDSRWRTMTVTRSGLPQAGLGRRLGHHRSGAVDGSMTTRVRVLPPILSAGIAEGRAVPPLNIGFPVNWKKGPPASRICMFSPGQWPAATMH
jgi:hypothetical protein